ncbi:MAG: hypothetical protein GOVbin568_24 [Prokaryotic dsDNA virus sp.]|nr:MAG: hypothetical protein GOVbin568_24 [Prokaryotic dsDNA virus sp.]|tara:strand:+ start:9942 stop:10589 length:648 start_codon:yes stop_codon:yes gene_type:complete
MKTQTVHISKIIPNKENPRTIDKVNFKKLKKSLEDFDVMLNIRPIVVDENMTILGGNMRYRALVELGHKEVPTIILTEAMIEKAIEKYQEKGVAKTRQDIIDEFVVKDNASFGTWDYDMLANNMHEMPLVDWGVEVPTLNEKAEIEEQEIVFSEYLDESHNYVVLLFDNDVDWLSAQTHFDLKSVHSKRQNGKPWSKGIGRVINGAEYLKSIKDV